LISESVEPRPQLILAVAAHEQRVEIEQLDLLTGEEQLTGRIPDPDEAVQHGLGPPSELGEPLGSPRRTAVFITAGLPLRRLL
jgi:hypothetical protein